MKSESLRKPFDAVLRPLGRTADRSRRWIARERWRVTIAVGFLIFLLLATPPACTRMIAALWDCVRGGCPASDWEQDIALLVGTALVFGLALLALSEVVRTVVWSRMRIVAPRAARCRALIMGLSDLAPHELAVLDPIKTRFAGNPERFAKPTAEFEQLSDFPDKGAAKTFAIKWQQNVRSVFHHGEWLEAVRVLPSEESLRQWTEFTAFMAALFPNLRVDLVFGDDGTAFRLPDLPNEPRRSYEDYDFVWAGLLRAVEDVQHDFAAKGRPIADDQICVDATPGQKPFSIAGATLTLNRALRLSYVSPGGFVTVYNAEIATAQSVIHAMNVGGAGL